MFGLSESCRSWSHVIVEKEVLGHLLQDIRMTSSESLSVRSDLDMVIGANAKHSENSEKKMKSYTILMSCD